MVNRMRIFIGCGSSDDVDSIYFTESKRFLDLLLRNNDLIFGAYDKGLMRECLDTAKKYNRKVVGVCPITYKDDIKHLNCNEEIITDTIIDRTKVLIHDSDAIVFLPGGIGTINEIFAAIDSKRTNEINKPILFFNINHYYDKLFAFLDTLYFEKFSSDIIKECYFITDDINEALEYLKLKEV